MKYYRTTSHSKYDLKAHIIFVPKYRKRVLHGEVGTRIRDLIRQICTEHEVEIISGKLAFDHVHLFVSYPPNLSISKLVQQIKGKSSYKIMQERRDLSKIYYGRHFWGRGYLAVSSGNITDEVIKQYIDLQEGEDLAQDNFIVED